jgi:muconolactone delta-isomerase
MVEVAGAPMKFLVTVTPRQVAPMPPGAIAEVLSAQRDWLKRKLKDGTLDCAYGFIGGGGVGIANADSIEEMHALLVQSPGFAIGDNEVRPLGDFNETVEAGIAALRQVASMMPGPAS